MKGTSDCIEKEGWSDIDGGTKVIDGGTKTGDHAITSTTRH